MRRAPCPASSTMLALNSYGSAPVHISLHTSKVHPIGSLTTPSTVPYVVERDSATVKHKTSVHEVE